MSKQAVGGHQVFSESECSAEYKASLACLDRNKYDKSECADEFDRYKECKKKEVQTRAERRRLKSAAEKESTATSG